MPPKADRNLSHLAGEYFVAAELRRRGYSIAIALGNAKAIGMFAERGVFVCLNAPGVPPDYLVCSPEEARQNTAQCATRGMIDLRRLKNPQFLERWDKIKERLLVLRSGRGETERISAERLGQTSAR